MRDPRPEERERLGLKEGEGVMVEGVLPDSPAAAAGVQDGDVILQANQTSVGSVAELKKEVDKIAADKPLLLLLRRADGNNRFVTLAVK